MLFVFTFTLFIPCVTMKLISHVTPTNALLYNLCVCLLHSFYVFRHYYGAIFWELRFRCQLPEEDEIIAASVYELCKRLYA